MINLITLLVLITGYSRPQEPKCICGSFPPFMYVEERSSIVAEVDVLGFGGFFPKENAHHLGYKFVEVKIREVLRGNEEVGNIIRIRGDHLYSCDENLRDFALHKKWIIAGHAVGVAKNKKGAIISNNYAISMCGTYKLKVTRNRIEGSIIGEKVTTLGLMGDLEYEYENVIEEMEKTDFYKLYENLKE